MACTTHTLTRQRKMAAPLATTGTTPLPHNRHRLTATRRYQCRQTLDDMTKLPWLPTLRAYNRSSAAGSAAWTTQGMACLCRCRKHADDATHARTVRGIDPRSRQLSSCMTCTLLRGEARRGHACSVKSHHGFGRRAETDRELPKCWLRNDSAPIDNDTQRLCDISA